MATVAGPVDVKVRADTSGLSGGIDAGRASLDKLRVASQQARATAESLGVGIRQQAQALEGAKRAADAATASTLQYRQALAQVREADAGLQRLYALLQQDPSAASRERILRLGEAYQKLRADAASTGQALLANGRAQATAAQATARLSGASSAANNTLVDLSRTINDIPFGIQGIANNLDPLLLGFRRLREQTGSARAAMAALGRSFIGPAGILTVINLAASAWILFEQQSRSALKKTGGEVDAFASRLDNLKNAFESLLRVDISGLGAFNATPEQARQALRDIDRQIAFVQQQVTRAYQSGLITQNDPVVAAQFAYQERTLADLQAGRSRILALLGEVSARETAAGVLRNLGLQETRQTRPSAGAARSDTSTGGTLNTVVGSDIDAIRARLSEVRRQIEGLQSIGEIGPIAAARQNAEALRQALEAAFALPTSQSGRGSLIASLTSELRSAEQAVLSALASGYGGDLDAPLQGRGPVAVDITAVRVEAQRARDDALDLGGALRDLPAPVAAEEGVARLTDSLSAVRNVAKAASQDIGNLGAGLALDAIAAIRGATDAQRRSLRLAEIDATRERQSLAESFREGSISAEEYQLRLAEVNDRLGQIKDSLPGLGAAFRTLGQGIGTVLKNVVADIIAATVRLLAFRAIAAGIDLISPGSGTIITTASGSGGFAKSGASEVAGGLSLVGGAASINAARGVIEIPVAMVQQAAALSVSNRMRVGGGA